MGFTETATVLLSTKACKVAEDTVSVRNKILSTNLSRWGDAKSKAKVKKKFPENFGAFYPSENGALGERLLNVITPIFLSTWGDSKSKGKVKKKFPENFGAFYPSENGPLGERLLNVTIQCNEQVWWCSGNSYQYVHSFNSNFQETLIYRVWLPFSQWLG